MPDTARHGLMAMYACLGALVIGVFAAAVSIDTYANDTVYTVLIGYAVASAIVVAVWWLRHRLRSPEPWKSFVDPQTGKTLPWVVEFVMSIGTLALMAWLVFYLAVSLLIFCTAHTPMRVLTRITVHQVGEGRCHVWYTYDNPPVRHRLDACGLPYPGAQTGATIRLVQQVGPFGFHLDRMEPVRDESQR